MPSASKRARRGSRRLPISELREAFADNRVWSGIGVVAKIDGEPHFEIADGDVLVSVTLIPTGEPLMCRLGAPGGGSGIGFWRIPTVGTEVAIICPTGELDSDPIIVAALTSGTAPDGLAENKNIFIVPDGETLEIRTPGGSVDRLVKKSEFDGHTHGAGTYKDGSNNTVTGTSAGAASVTGTAVLRSE